MSTGENKPVEENKPVVVESLKKSLKAVKRRSVQKVYETMVSSSQTGTRFDAKRQCFQKMVGDLDQLGAGLSLHLAWAHRYFANATTLAEVLQEETIAEASHTRWRYLHSTVRRSMNAVIVNRGLDPLRHFVRRTAKDVKKSCEKRDGALLDVKSYARRKEDAKKEAAQRHFDQLDAAASEDLRKAKLARDVLVADATTVLLAAQAELFASAADYFQDTANAFDDDKITAFRQEIRHFMANGGPDLVDKAKPTRLRTALDIGTGKKSFKDVRNDELRRQERHRQHHEAASGIELPSKPPPPPTPPKGNNFS